MEQTQHERILIVAPDLQTLKALRVQLAPDSADIFTATNPATACRLLKGMTQPVQTVWVDQSVSEDDFRLVRTEAMAHSAAVRRFSRSVSGRFIPDGDF
ncbi:MAG: hypothetical protein HUU10_13765 [Bacteroidetes bacterium]|nr:hypothetical protein [Bacteroidota bacterium]